MVPGSIVSPGGGCILFAAWKDQVLSGEWSRECPVAGEWGMGAEISKLVCACVEDTVPFSLMPTLNVAENLKKGRVDNYFHCLIKCYLSVLSKYP